MYWKLGMMASVLVVLGLALAQPSPRAYMEMTYDAESEVLVLFGGQLGDISRSDAVSGETWIFDPSEGSWQQRTPEHAPQPLVAANAAYDSARDRVVLWGGGTAEFHLANEVWSYDENSDTWELHEAASAAAPVGRIGSEMVYDASADRFVVFGGFDPETGSYLAETWLLDMETESWTLVDSEEAPQGRNFTGLAYEPRTERVYLWGGGGPLHANVWELDTEAGVWTQREYSQDAPYPRNYLEVESLDDLGALLVYGGPQGTDNDLTWLYDPSSHTWEQVASDGPGMRTRFAMAHAGPHGTYLFGGQPGNEQFQYTNDLWRFDSVSMEWSEVQTR